MKWIFATLMVLAALFLLQGVLFSESCFEQIERLNLAGNFAAADLVDCSTNHNSNSTRAH